MAGLEEKETESENWQVYSNIIEEEYFLLVAVFSLCISAKPSEK